MSRRGEARIMCVNSVHVDGDGWTRFGDGRRAGERRLVRGLGRWEEWGDAIMGCPYLMRVKVLLSIAVW